MIKSFYTTLPIGLCKYALVNRKINQLKLYLYLKLTSSGYIRYEDNINEHITNWSIELNLDRKTVSSSFKWLIENKWITVNSISKALHIKGYSALAKKLKLIIKSSVIYEPTDFKDLKGICCASVIIYYRNKLKYFNRKNKSVVNMRLTKKNLKLLKNGSYFLPLTYIAKSLKISKSTANNFKKIALEFGFIERSRNVYTVTDSNENPILKEAYYSCSKQILNNGRLRRGKKYLKMVGEDIISSNIHLKKFRF